MNKNIVATISHNEYKNVSLNNKCLRHSMDRIQSKNHKIETYEINNKNIYHAFMTIHVLNNEYDRLDLG